MRSLIPVRPPPQPPAAVPGHRAPVPGEVLLQPASLAALVVLVVNDHWLKALAGGRPTVGMLTGKVSDVAGLAFFPLLLVSLVEVTRWARAVASTAAATGRTGRWGTTFDTGTTFAMRDLVVAVMVTGIGFAAVQTLPVAAELYSQGLAVLRWFPSGLAASVTGSPPPPPPSVAHTMDPTDVLCLPALWCSHRIGRRVLHHRATPPGTVHTCDVGAAPTTGSGGKWSGA